MSVIEKAKKAVSSPLINFSQVARLALKIGKPESEDDKYKIANFGHKLSGRKKLSNRESVEVLRVMQSFYSSLHNIFKDEDDAPIPESEPWDCECKICGDKFLEIKMPKKNNGFTDIPYYCPNDDCYGEGNDIKFYNV